MVLNTILRFWWLLPFSNIIIKLEKSGVEGAYFSLMKDFEMLSFVSMMAEAIRRSIWSLLRVENEFFNNFEEYRDFLVIPPIKDDSLDDNNNHVF